MEKDFFVGIDGGGSKTHLRLETSDGKVLAETFSGPGNIRLSIETTYQSIDYALNKALEKSKLINKSDIRIHAGIGVAGFEVPSAREGFLQRKNKFNFASLVVQSDAYIACLGAHAGKPGSVIIVGTGVVGLKIDRNAKRQVGGWGFPHGDEGGAAWLGLESIRMLLYFCDGRGEGSPLLKYLKQKFKGRVEEITQWACYANASQFAEIARDVFKFADKGDELAIQLLKLSAKHIEKIILALDEKEKNKDKLPFVLFGGVAPFILEFLKPSLKKRLAKPQGDACDGALLMIRKNINHNNK
ncbi:BadF/BadG/BcrA/BcrD ATPase family protein [Silvanigrella sp.]|jgi:glucosamine kinase|uniref:BadF/BadG/BcrA/BcrD ATPase family protein n=1 Tax=Silvanigrella sp. TaxID=2024976 RepID=UPI0037C9F341|nr:hypothetical protein [Silvanigrellaceae bacterium]